jgi:hypothetical protein
MHMSSHVKQICSIMFVVHHVGIHLQFQSCTLAYNSFIVSYNVKSCNEICVKLSWICTGMSSNANLASIHYNDLFHANTNFHHSRLLLYFVGSIYVTLSYRPQHSFVSSIDFTCPNCTKSLTNYRHQFVNWITHWINSSAYFRVNFIFIFICFLKSQLVLNGFFITDWKGVPLTVTTPRLA